MEFALKQSSDFARLDPDKLRSLAPHDSLKILLAGLTDAISQIVLDRIALPEEMRCEILSRWRDPKFQDNLREGIQMVVATALRQEIPGALAEPIAAYLTDKVLYPAVKSSGDQLLDKICHPGASTKQDSLL